MGLTGQDMTLCWVKRRIQSLQYMERLMHQYVGPIDSLWVCRAEMTSSVLDQKMTRIIKIGRSQHTYSFGLDMFTHDNKCPKVVFAYTSFLFMLSFNHFCLTLSLFQLYSLRT